jgi:hypothetical protein
MCRRSLAEAADTIFTTLYLHWTLFIVSVDTSLIQWSRFHVADLIIIQVANKFLVCYAYLFTNFLIRLHFERDAHSTLSTAFCCHLSRSSHPSSSSRLPSGLLSSILLTTLHWYIRTRCPIHSILCLLMSATLSEYLYSSHNSWLVLILLITCSTIGPYILLNIFLSNATSLFISISVIGHLNLVSYGKPKVHYHFQKNPPPSTLVPDESSPHSYNVFNIHPIVSLSTPIPPKRSLPFPFSGCSIFQTFLVFPARAAYFAHLCSLLWSS